MTKSAPSTEKAYTILIVDDEDDIIDLLQYNLEKEGYNISSATNGIEGIELARQIKPDLIILDIMMPKLDGFEVCKAIRANPDWNSVRIIMLTAKGRDSEREKGLELGAGMR